MKSDLVKRLKELEIVEFKSIILKSGQKSNYYIDVKKSYGYPDVFGMICDIFFELIGSEVNCVASSGYGGLPPASVLSKDHGFYHTMVRDSVKDHGRKAMIEGYIPGPNDKIAVIDDVLTTGTNLRNIVKSLRLFGSKIQGCYVVVQRGPSNLSIPTYSILSDKDFLEN